MKKLITLLAVLGLASVASAQFVPGPAPQTALTISTAFLIPGSTTTNIPTTLAPQFRGGRDGVAIYLRLGATNAASTTNATFIFETLAGPASEVVDNGGTFTVSSAQGGTTGYDYLTNVPASTANILNAPSFRIRSIQNTNLASIWVSNVVAYTR
jgi:hypothetical protein